MGAMDYSTGQIVKLCDADGAYAEFRVMGVNEDGLMHLIGPEPEKPAWDPQVLLDEQAKHPSTYEPLLPPHPTCVSIHTLPDAQPRFICGADCAEEVVELSAWSHHPLPGISR